MSSFALSLNTFILALPLQGETITNLLSQNQRENLPDSVVLLHSDGRLATQWAAVTGTLQSLGGFWSLFGRLLSWVPERLGNWLYARVATVRTRIFSKPKSMCPMLPSALQKRLTW